MLRRDDGSAAIAHGISRGDREAEWSHEARLTETCQKRGRATASILQHTLTPSFLRSPSPVCPLRSSPAASFLGPYFLLVGGEIQLGDQPQGLSLAGLKNRTNPAARGRSREPAAVRLGP